LGFVISFDVGQSLGWAVFEGDSLVDSGRVRLAGKTHTKNAAKLEALFERFSPDACVFEAVGFVSFRDAHASYWRLRTLIEYTAERAGVEIFEDVPTSTLKKFATGNGRASKVEMVTAARDRFGVELYAAEEEGGRKADEDVADAIHVGAWYAETHG